MDVRGTHRRGLTCVRSTDGGKGSNRTILRAELRVRGGRVGSGEQGAGGGAEAVASYRWREGAAAAADVVAWLVGT